MSLRRWVSKRTARAAAALLAASFLLAGCDAHMDSFNIVTRQGSTIERLFVLSFILCLVVFLIVFGVLVYVLLRYRWRPGQGEPRQVTGNRPLEIIWITIPVLMLTTMFVLSVLTMNRVAASQPGALQVTVIGHQWWWEFRYPDLRVTTANELYVPVGRPVTLKIQAADVIHSFWVPKFGWKMDAIPTKTNTMQIRVDQAGTWEGTCTEYCGAEHAWMRIKVVAEPRTRFHAWEVAQRKPAAAPQSAEARRGKQVFLSSTCVNCHTIAGTAAHGTVGPNLTHLGSRSTLGAGVLANNSANLAKWISHVQEVKPASLMPNFNLSSADLKALVAYLEGLK